MNAAPRTAFANVSCSMCGNSFGPGISGYSSCSEHRKPEHEIEFYSRELKGTITCGFEGDEEVTNYQFAIVCGSIELVSISVGGVDITQHMLDTSKKVIEFELGAALQRLWLANAGRKTRIGSAAAEQAAEYAA